MKNNYFILFILVFLFISAEAYSQDVVFIGIPVVKNSSSHDESTNKKIQDQDQVTYKLTIVKEGDEYYWSSRSDKPLKYKKNGPFHYFYDDSGASYIKIMEAEEGKYIYMEHISLGFKTISYWGGGSKLKF